MKRRLTRFLFALGLLLTLAAVAMLARGSWATEHVVLRWHRTPGGGIDDHGVVWVIGTRRVIAVSYDRKFDQYTHPVPPAAEKYRFTHESRPPTPVSMRLRDYSLNSLAKHLGFEFSYASVVDKSSTVTSGYATGQAMVPTWLIAVVGLMLAFPYARCLRRARALRLRREQGFCPACAYDLRGADHDRCPECGHLVSVLVSHGDPSSLSKMK